MKHAATFLREESERFARMAELCERIDKDRFETSVRLEVVSHCGTAIRRLAEFVRAHTIQDFPRHPLERWLAWPPPADGDGKESIGINGHQVFAPTHVTYQEVVAFAFPKAPTLTYSVKYRGAVSPKRDGVMKPGDVVHVGLYTRFTVVRTGDA